jgi:hypothetical protein
VGGQNTCCSSVPSTPPRAAPPKAPPARPSPPRTRARASPRPRLRTQYIRVHTWLLQVLGIGIRVLLSEEDREQARQRPSAKYGCIQEQVTERVPRCAVLQARGRAERARADWGNHEYEYALAASTRQPSTLTTPNLAVRDVLQEPSNLIKESLSPRTPHHSHSHRPRLLGAGSRT